MRRRLRGALAGTGAAALAGCAQLPAPDPAFLVCHLPPIAGLPLSTSQLFVSVRAAVDGKPAELLVDTGAETSVLTPDAAARLGLEPEAGRATLFGAGGSLSAAYARVHVIAVPGAAVPLQRVVVTPLNTPSGPLDGVDGVLGLDWLRTFDVELDVPGRRMALYPAGACTGPKEGVMGTGTTSIPIQLAGAGLVLVPAELDHRALIALLDSGATSTTLNSAARRAAPLIPSESDPVSQSTGIDGIVRPRREHRFAQLQVGSVTYPNPPIGIATVRIPVEMLLGLNWLRGTRIWLSFAARRLTLFPVRGG